MKITHLLLATAAATTLFIMFGLALHWRIERIKDVTDRLDTVVATLDSIGDPDRLKKD